MLLLKSALKSTPSVSVLPARLTVNAGVTASPVYTPLSTFTDAFSTDAPTILNVLLTLPVNPSPGSAVIVIIPVPTSVFDE